MCELAIPTLTPLLFKLLYVLVRSMNTKWRAPRDPRVTPPLWLLELAIFAVNPLIIIMLYVWLELFLQNGALLH